MSNSLQAVCFGEVLFDVFPTHQKIGGAPLNVALRLNSLGIDTQIISRIGADDLGQQLLTYVHENQLSTEGIQTDESLATGAVLVTLNEKGSASYTINYPAAWDKIVCAEADKHRVQEADVFIFGSLACRDAVSHASLLQLLDHANFKVFDVNFRKPFYEKDLVISLMHQADFIKCNDEELPEICTYIGVTATDIESQVRELAAYTNTKQVCVTLGDKGALLFDAGEFIYHSGYVVKVKDTVGAGDSFLAGLLSQLLQNKPKSYALNFACALGALVASHEGANPSIDHDTLVNFMQS